MPPPREASPHFSPGAVMIAEDFGPVYTRGQKTREGAANAVRHRHVSVRFSRDLLVRTLLRFISAGPMAKGW